MERDKFVNRLREAYINQVLTNVDTDEFVKSGGMISKIYESNVDKISRFHHLKKS